MVSKTGSTTAQFHLKNEQATIALGMQLAAALTAPMVIYLTGDLGAGKTTFSRGVIQALGHKGAVKSPTYTLVEPYEFNDLIVYHFDLYRLLDPEELEFMGIRDYFSERSISLIEWPDRGQGLIPKADLLIHIEYDGSERGVNLSSQTDKGSDIVSRINNEHA